MSSLYDYFDWVTAEAIPFDLSGSQTLQIIIGTPEEGVYTWGLIGAGQDCTTIKSTWDTYGFFGALTLNSVIQYPITPIVMDDSYCTLSGTSDLSTAKITSTISDIKTGDLLGNVEWNYGSSGWSENIIIAFPSSLDGSTLVDINYTVATNTIDSCTGNFPLYNPQTTQVKTGESDNLFYYIFPQCKVTPSAGTNLAGFSYPQDAPSETDFSLWPNWTMAPLKTRMPFQNYTFSFPFIKGSK